MTAGNSPYSDAARRCSDAVNLALIGQAGAAGRWIAVRLSDGGSDGVLYDQKSDAVRHQLHESLCAYIKIPPDGMTPRLAEVFLKFNRQLYDAGMRMQDPAAHAETPLTALYLPPGRRTR